MKIVVYDIETLEELFLVVAVVPGERKMRWEISRWRNDLYAFIKYVEEHKDYYWVGYNNLRFDSQVVEWILRNYEYWLDLSNLEITHLIAQKAQDTIDDSNYDVFPEFREESLSLKQIDLFRIHHFDNKNRRVSLKRLEFEMDMPNVEEMPIHHKKTNLTREDVVTTINYCANADIPATIKFYNITTGNTDHPLYKGNNQIQLRLDIEEEFGIKCMNFSDSKIGDELIKKYYCEEKRISYGELPRKGTFRKIVKVKDCIASYVEFKTPQLNNFLKQIRKETLGIKETFVKELKLFNNTYTFAKGGLHTVNKPEIFEATGNTLIIDWDAASYYPASIINNGRYPAHLGKEFLLGYKKMFERRIELKSRAKTDKRIAGIVSSLKLAVNSVYGKSSDMQNWMYDRLLTMFTTITGELSLMMLIEAYELKGIHVISANTDGVTIMIDKSQLDTMFKINQWWMEVTGYMLERTDYKKIVFSSVNDYIAIKTDGDVKKKGDFVTDFELYKNKSARIIPMALEAYFVQGIPVETTIKNHRNIYDFVKRQKSSSNFHYEGISSSGKKRVYNKLVRYYVSNTGEKLLKIKNPECTTNAAKISQIEAGEWLVTVCNKLTNKHTMDNINYEYYIERANRIVNKVESRGRRTVREDKQQLSLF